MIRTEIIGPDALKIVAPERLKSDDFRQLAPEVESMISKYGKIRLLIDGSRLEGWENIGAFETHAAFVKDHQQQVERIAVIAAHEWQHWLVGCPGAKRRVRRKGGLPRAFCSLVRTTGFCGESWARERASSAGAKEFRCFVRKERGIRIAPSRAGGGPQVLGGP